MDLLLQLIRFKKWNKLGEIIVEKEEMMEKVKVKAKVLADNLLKLYSFKKGYNIVALFL